MSKKIVRTDRAPAPVGPYSQGVVLDGWLYVSGQVGLDPETGRLCGDDAATQADRALRNLQAIVEAAGASLERVVRATVYLTDMDDFAAVNEVYANYFADSRPARATVEVSRLPVGARVEIDAIARIG